MSENAVRFVVEGTNWDEHQITEVIVNRFAEKVEERVDRAIRGQVTAYIEGTLKAQLEARINATIESILSEGWVATNQWGESNGGKVTFRERVSKILTERDSYSRESSIAGLVKRMVEETLRGDFAKEVEEARRQVRAMLDGALNEKLAKALREGLGLK